MFTGVLNFVGLQEIIQYTKQSLREKPFSTAKGKIWTETPSSIPLEKIYTKLKWLKKDTNGEIVETVEISDITELLSAKQLQSVGDKDLVRIGVKGNLVNWNDPSGGSRGEPPVADPGFPVGGTSTPSGGH